MRSIHFDSNFVYDVDGNITYDRPNSAEGVRKVFKSFIGNGVEINPSTTFKVLPGEGMGVLVSPGKAWIEGAFCWEEDVRELAIQASTSLDRIDRVVLRLDLTMPKRDIDLYILTGMPATLPIAPVYTRNDTIYELVLADIFVAKNSTGITTQRITDQRYNNTLCGVVHAVFEQADLTDIFNQYESYLNDNIALWEARKVQQQADWQSQMVSQQTTFTGKQTEMQAWYDTIRNDINIRQAVTYEDIIAMPGISNKPTFNGDGSVLERAWVTLTNKTVATFDTVFGSSAITQTFKIFDDDGETLLRHWIFETDNTTLQQKVTEVAV